MIKSCGRRQRGGGDLSSDCVNRERDRVVIASVIEIDIIRLGNLAV